MENYYISRDGIKDYQRNNRPLLGDGVQEFAPAIGTAMLDGTICDIYLVNESGQLVGRPVLVIACDANTSLCLGYSLLWEGGTYSLQTLMLNILEDKVGVTSFMVGNQGGFDSMVLKALRELKQVYPHICYNVVLAYMPGEKQEYEFYDPTETFLPEGIETAPKRFAISWRNKWMVRESQLVVCYISHSWGGAAQFVEYAEKQGKEIINLATKD